MALMSPMAGLAASLALGGMKAALDTARSMLSKGSEKDERELTLHAMTSGGHASDPSRPENNTQWRTAALRLRGKEAAQAKAEMSVTTAAVTTAESITRSIRRQSA
jgi:hypothetical protein